MLGAPKGFSLNFLFGPLDVSKASATENDGVAVGRRGGGADGGGAVEEVGVIPLGGGGGGGAAGAPYKPVPVTNGALPFPTPGGSVGGAP